MVDTRVGSARITKLVFIDSDNGSVKSNGFAIQVEMTARENLPYESFNQHESNEFVIVNSTKENVQIQSGSNENPGSTIVKVPEASPQNADVTECAPNNRADNETDGKNTT